MTEAAVNSRPEKLQIPASLVEAVLCLRLVGLIAWRLMQVVVICFRGALPWLALTVGLLANVLMIQEMLHK